MRLSVAGKSVRATTGGRPHVSTQPLLIFLHAAGADRTAWALQTRYFASRGWSVLALDLPGHGGSEGPALASIERLAAWTVDVIETAGWDRAALVGHSLGAQIALETASQYPDAVSHLALVAAAEQMPVSTKLLAASRDDPAAAWDMVMDWGLSSGSHLGGHPTPGLWVHGTGWKIMAAGQAGSLYADFSAADAYDGSDAAKKVSCPVLVAHGSEDRMVRLEGARRLAETLGTQVAVLEGAGHFINLERPEELLDLLAGFLT